MTPQMPYRVMRPIPAFWRVLMTIPNLRVSYFRNDKIKSRSVWFMGYHRIGNIFIDIPIGFAYLSKFSSCAPVAQPG